MKQGFVISVVVVLFLLISSAYSQVSKTFKFNNKTGVTITSLRVASNDTYDWSLPLNTQEKVMNNQSFNFTMKIDTARCIYDFKFTTDDGTDYILEDITLCAKADIDLVIPEKKEKD